MLESLGPVGVATVAVATIISVIILHFTTKAFGSKDPDWHSAGIVAVVSVAVQFGILFIAEAIRLQDPTMTTITIIAAVIGIVIPIVLVHALYHQTWPKSIGIAAIWFTATNIIVRLLGTIVVLAVGRFAIV